MRETGRMSFRDGTNGAAHQELLQAVACAFRRLPPAEGRAALGPKWSKFDRQQLRAEIEGYFGWDRLHNAAIALGVPIAPIWARHQQLEAA